MEHIKCLVPFQLNMMQSQAVSAPMATSVAVEGSGGTGKSYCILARLLFLCQQLPAGTPMVVLVATPYQCRVLHTMLEEAIKEWCLTEDSPLCYQWYGQLDSIAIAWDIEALPKASASYLLVDDFLSLTKIQQERIATQFPIPQTTLFITGDSTAHGYSLEEQMISLWGLDCKVISLHENHRTDCALLGEYHQRIKDWNLPFYKSQGVGCQRYNHYAPWLVEHPQSFFHQSTIGSEEMRMAALIEELGRIEKRLAYEKEQGIEATSEVKTIGILVETGSQQKQVVNACQRAGLKVSSGVPLYQREGAVDLWKLLEAISHPTSLPHLYQLLDSKWMQIQMPKSNLYQIKNQSKKKGLSTEAVAQAQLDYLVDSINERLQGWTTWEHLVHLSYTKSLFHVLVALYRRLQPWMSLQGFDSQYQQDCAQLLSWVERQEASNPLPLAQALKHQMAQHIAQVGECWPLSAISCMTISQASGLEFGHVVVPFCATKVDGVGGEDLLLRKRLLYGAMSSAIRSFSWIALLGASPYTWQQLLLGGGEG